MNKTDVAIIIVNWNNANDTVECISSIELLDYVSFKLYIVDNGSTDDSYKIIKSRLSKTTVEYELIASKDNLGFSGGNNIALLKAMEEGYNYFWLINNDTVFKNNALSALVNASLDNNNAGMLGSKIFFYNSDQLWYAGGKIDYNTGKASSIGRGQNDSEEFNKITETDYITGCSLFVKREVINSIGLLEDGFFLYYEDTDWSLRARSAGWQCLYVPDSVIEHKVGQSTDGGYSSPFLSYYNLRNRYLMTVRNKCFFTKTGPLKYLVKRSFSLIVIAILRKDKKIERIKYAILGVTHGIFKKLGRHK